MTPNQTGFVPVTHDRALQASLVAAVGASHVRVGSDYPFDMGSAVPVGEVLSLRLPADEEVAVLWGNATNLFEHRGPHRPGP